MKKIVWTTSSFGFTEFPADWSIVANPHGRRLTEDEALELLTTERPVGMIAGVEPLTRRVLEAAPDLRVISRCGVGLDSVDLVAADELGIKVLTTPAAVTQSVAELAVGLMLTLLRGIAVSDADMKQGTWRKVAGNLLGDKTVGVLGCGRIGTRVGQLARAFGCRVIGHDPFLESHAEIDLMSLDQLCSGADIITLHVPLTDQNRNLVDEPVLRSMKGSAILVNTARGELVDERALIRAIEEGWIAGAALDVYESEPYSGRLTELGDRVVLTSHMGTAAREARTEMERQAVENLENALRSI